MELKYMKIKKSYKKYNFKKYKNGKSLNRSSNKYNGD